MVVSRLIRSLTTLLLLGAFWGQAFAGSQQVLTDEELDSVQASGFYFLMDLSLQVFSDSTTAPQVVINTSSQSFPTSSVPAAVNAGAATVSLSGSAQSNLNSLINVIGAASVINVGVNIVNITNSSNDVINSTNLNAAGQGSNISVTIPTLP